MRTFSFDLKKCSWNVRVRSPVKMFLDHFGDGMRHGLLLRRQTLVEAHTQPLLQEVDDEIRATHFLLVIFDPRHLSLRRKLPIKVVLPRWEEKTNRDQFGQGSKK